MRCECRLLWFVGRIVPPPPPPRPPLGGATVARYATMHVSSSRRLFFFFFLISAGCLPGPILATEETRAVGDKPHKRRETGVVDPSEQRAEAPRVRSDLPGNITAVTRSLLAVMI